jgi:hypothetical protein
LDKRSYRLLCLTGYFEGILKMEGASGLSQVIAPPRKYGDKKIPVVIATPIDPTSATDPPAVAEAAPAPPARGRKPRQRAGGT